MINLRIVNDATKSLGIETHICELRLVLECFGQILLSVCACALLGSTSGRQQSICTCAYTNMHEWKHAYQA